MAIRLFQKLKRRIQRRRERTSHNTKKLHHPNDQPIPTIYTANNSYYSSNYISDSSSSLHSSSRTYDSNTSMSMSMMSFSTQQSKQELEGTLLPPSASAPPLEEGEDSNVITATAVSAIPVDYFHYSNNNNNTTNNNTNDTEIPTATNLLSYNEAVIASPNEQARAVTHQTNFGTDMGRIRSSEERDCIKRGERESLAKNYHEKQAVERANQEMKERKRMDKFLGKNSNVLMKDSNNNDMNGSGCIEESNTSGTKVMSVEAVSSQKKKTGGGEYEVQEYDVVEYSGSDYDSTYEYKSVYDS